MNLHHIQYFCDVVRTQSFSQAATLNFVSQTTVSQAVDTLEKQLMTPLIQHQSRPVVTTPAGRFFYRQGQRLLAQYQETEQKTLAYIQDQSQTLLVLYVHPGELITFKPAFQAFQQTQPALNLQFKRTTALDLQTELLTRPAAVAVYRDQPQLITDASIQSTPLMTSKLVFGTATPVDETDLWKKVQQTGILLQGSDQLAWQQLLQKRPTLTKRFQSFPTLLDLSIQTIWQQGVGLFNPKMADYLKNSPIYLALEEPVFEFQIQLAWVGNHPAAMVQALVKQMGAQTF